MHRLGVLLAALAALLSSCSTAGYAFRVDKTMEVVAPRARDTVALPVTIRWRDDQPPVNLRVDPSDPNAEYYGVFVDRAPLGPNRKIVSLVNKNDSCRNTPGCPDAAFLAKLKVFFTAKPELTLEFLSDLRPSKRGDSKDPHEIAIVRMRGDQRVGEAAFLRSFFVDRG